MRTSCPRSVSARATCAPTNPVAPVTQTFIGQLLAAIAPRRSSCLGVFARSGLGCPPRRALNHESGQSLAAESNRPHGGDRAPVATAAALAPAGGSAQIANG